MRRTRHPLLAICVAGALVAGCSSTATTTAPTTSLGAPASSTSPATTMPATIASAAATAGVGFSGPPPPATFRTRPGPAQLAVTGATPGTTLQLDRDEGSSGSPVNTGTVDAQGSILWRRLDPGNYRVIAADGTGAVVTVPSLDATPPTSLYTSQTLPAGGFGYLSTRDGTTLSINVVLPGPAKDGPYPTVVEYSGYSPSNPDDNSFAQLYSGLGFAYVGINMRGTGCSGGSYQFFEPMQELDGYDAIEAVAAQPWVQGGTVGMVGISYPGISQLFVAQTRPPHLSAITPLSVLDDSYRSTLYPGGMLNTGFAGNWTAERDAEAKPFGQGWTKTRADHGDTVCAANQELRLQNPDQVQLVKDHPFDDSTLYAGLAPADFVGKIDVPVFLAGAWQDEQTGGHFPAMLDKFTSSPHLYATLVNGLHTESVSLGILTEYLEFLDLYVAHRAPDLRVAALAAPTLAKVITGVDGLGLPASQLSGLSYEDALKAFEARPPIRVLFEEGAADGTPAGSPLPRFEARFDRWPVPGAATTVWYLTEGGVLASTPGTAAAAAASYVANPKAVAPTFYTGDSSTIWQANVKYDWPKIPAENRATWTTAPLTADTTVLGSGSVDLWLESSAADTDLEATISEVRPDGTEVYVQSGWLRASKRALDTAATTELRPVHTFAEADAAPLPSGQFTLTRVELFPVGHVFRAGSELRLTVAAPGGNRAVWTFDTLPGGERDQIAQDAAHASRLVIPVVSGVKVPAGLPACGSLRGQPCRPA